jgi:type II secretory pathway pseudopilin PulG
MSLKQRLSSETGFGLVEVMVTALIVLILASGVLGGLQAASHASGRNKARSVAMTLAQKDQERLRAMLIGDLENVRASDTTDIPVCDPGGGHCVSYTVASQADWVKDSTGIASCTTAPKGFDYLKLTSTVTWPAMDGKPITTESLLTPKVGDMGTGTGNLAVQIKRADGVTGVPGVTVNLSGPESYSDVTNDQGCVVFGALSVGNYDVGLNQAGFVDLQGVQAVDHPVSVTADSVNSVTLLYDGAATATVTFSTNQNGVDMPDQKVDAITVSQNQMTPVIRTFRTPNAPTTATSITTLALFPFSSNSAGKNYNIYAGDCDGENPVIANEVATALKTLPDLTGGAGVNYTLQIPSIDFSVKAPVGATNVGTRFVETTTGCVNLPAASVPVVPVLATGTNAGHPDQAGVPYGTYDVCAQATLTTAAVVHKTVTGVTVSKLPGTTVTYPGDAANTFDLTSGTAAGPC